MFEDEDITIENIKTFAVAHTAEEHSRITSASFSHDGIQIAYSLADDEIKLLTLDESGVSEKRINVKKHGAGLVKFYDEQHLVQTSTKYDHHLRLLNLEQMHYSRYFPGHSQEVISVVCAPRFIASGSKDTTIRIWDPREQMTAKFHAFPSAPLLALHPYGNQESIAVGYNSNTIEIRTLKEFDKTISKLELEKIEGVEWTNLEFSSNGRYLLITTNTSLIYVVNMEQRKLQHRFTDYSNKENMSIGACFSSDSRFVFGGSDNGLIHVWSLESSLKEVSLRSFFEGPINDVLFNPNFMNLATISNGENLQLWNENTFY